MLRIESLTAGYGRIAALHDVALDVPQGAIVCLLGANGAGKTTTLNCISGVVPVRGGCILFEGDDIAGLSPDRIVARGVVQVPEGRAIFRSMTVRDNLSMGAWRRRDTAGIAHDFDHALSLFPALRPRLAQRAGTLSGGEQQMLMIGRALLARPRLLLLDEPSLGLSPLLIQTMFAVIAGLRDAGISVLLVEQNASSALGISQYGYVLENGEIATHGTATTLAADTAVRDAYLGT